MHKINMQILWNLKVQELPYKKNLDDKGGVMDEILSVLLVRCQTRKEVFFYKKKNQ